MYMRDVDVEIETQSRDVLEFPNYCLIIPFDVLKGFHAALQARNFRRIMTSKEPHQEFPDLDDYRINQTSASKIVSQLCNRLQIPNIIAIDTKNNNVYYKFMYMQNVNMIKLNTLQTYVKNQGNIISKL